MRQDEIWDAEVAQNYDTPGSGMFAPEVLGPAVDRLRGSWLKNPSRLKTLVPRSNESPDSPIISMLPNQFWTEKSKDLVG